VGQVDPTPLGEPPEGGRQDQTRSSNDIVFPQHEVGGQIVGSPAVEQSGRARANLLEQVAQLTALPRVQRNLCHIAVLKRPAAKPLSIGTTNSSSSRTVFKG
jgi:hypothetical protein